MIDQAIDQFQHALRFKPDDAEAHSNLGLAYKHKGWTDKAIEEYQRALGNKIRISLKPVTTWDWLMPAKD